MLQLAGSTILTDNPEPTIAGGQSWTRIVIQPFTTIDATPTTPSLLQFMLDPGERYGVRLMGAASTTASGWMFEFDVRNAWFRDDAGVSVRLGTSGGQATSLGTTYPAPAATRPRIVFTDPADVLTPHQAWARFVGRAGVSVRWDVVAFVQRGA